MHANLSQNGKIRPTDKECLQRDPEPQVSGAGSDSATDPEKAIRGNCSFSECKGVGADRLLADSGG